MATGTAKKSALRERAPRTTARREGPRPKDARAAGLPARPPAGPASREAIRNMAEALGRLADEGRLRILFLLDETSRNVAALGEAMGQDRHSLSHHLRILRVSGL